jgi:hypothetical protein
MRRRAWALGSSVVFVVFGVAMQAQQPPAGQEKKPEGTPVGQDKADITGTLEAWYRLERKTEYVGFAHAVLKRAPSGSPWRYEYLEDEDQEFMLPDPKDPTKQVPVFVSRKAEGKLDDTYAPVEWRESASINSQDVNALVTVDDAGARKIEISFSQRDRRAIPASEEETHYSRFLLFVSLRQNSNLARPGVHRASLFHLQPEGRHPVQEVTVEVGESMKREYLGKKDVAVTKVRFLKPPASVNKDLEPLDAFIDKYGRIVELSTRGGFRMILAKGEEEAVSKDLVLRLRGRRDPFRKDLAMSFKRPIREGVSAETEGAIVKPDGEGGFQKSLASAQKLLEELKRAKEDGREDDGQKYYLQLLEYGRVLKNFLMVKPQGQDMVKAVDEIRKEAEKIWDGAGRLMRQLNQIYAKVLEDFKNDRVEEGSKGLEELKKAQERPELESTEHLVELSKMVATAEPLLQQAKTRLELGAKKIILIGTLYSEERVYHTLAASVSILGHEAGGSQEVRFLKPTWLAVINDKVYRVGDTVEVEGGGVRVEKITAHDVQVSLREQTRNVGIRQ